MLTLLISAMSGCRGLLRAAVALLLLTAMGVSAQERELLVGVADHAFDHLGGIPDQAPVAAACGVNIIYGSGFGGLYDGMKSPQEMSRLGQETSDYLRHARQNGIKLAIGYVCATSLVKLDTFDRNWPAEFRKQFSASPASWLQCDAQGQPLPSWYGGDYRPACMNNPNWRLYEKFVVRRQLEAGFDGIFFDNPTVHQQGCYCEYCMRRFATFAASHGLALDSGRPVAELRKAALDHPQEFQQFRVTIASDFLADMRTFARTINPHALMTCNNSLNSPDALFAQCHNFAYDIFEMSKVEDLVVVEDMATQPRVRSDGTIAEYGPAYEILAAISHGKPVVACTIADGDYHTAPNLMRLAMAEAAAHGASYLSWPTWPQEMRAKMIAGVRPEADFLRQHAPLLNGGHRRADVIIFLPFRQWTQTAVCHPLQWANALSAANIPFRVICEEDLVRTLAEEPSAVLLAQSPSVLLETERSVFAGKVVWVDENGKKDWLARLKKTIGQPSLMLKGPSTIRVAVSDLSGKTIVHLLNLDVRRVSSYDDTIRPVDNVDITLHVPLATVHGVTANTADSDASSGPIHFTSTADSHGSEVRFTIPKAVLSTILIVE
jgi:hypothetical protein